MSSAGETPNDWCRDCGYLLSERHHQGCDTEYGRHEQDWQSEQWADDAAVESKADAV